MRRSAWLGVLLGGALGASTLTAQSDPGRIEQLQQELRRLRGLEARYRSSEHGVLDEIGRLTAELLVAERERELADLELERGAEAQARLEARGQELARRHELDRQVLRSALVRAYARPRLDWLASLVSSDSPVEIPRNLRMLGFLGKREAQALDRYAEQAAELETTRAELARQDLELKSLIQASEARSAELSRSRARKESFLEDLSRLRKSAAAELSSASRELASFLDGLPTTPAKPLETRFAAARGLLPWPVRAEIRKRFGVERHPRFQTLTEHAGLDFAASSGSEVRAVHAGRVAFADWFKGYGQLVILEHGESYYTLYAHLREISVSRGAEVQRGALLGRSGETGSLAGPSLYFELRHAQQALDPEPWLTRRP